MLRATAEHDRTLRNRTDKTRQTKLFTSPDHPYG
jgi:hypothetical protein